MHAAKAAAERSAAAAAPPLTTAAEPDTATARAAATLPARCCTRGGRLVKQAATDCLPTGAGRDSSSTLVEQRLHGMVVPAGSRRLGPEQHFRHKHSSSLAATVGRARGRAASCMDGHFLSRLFLLPWLAVGPMAVSIGCSRGSLAEISAGDKVSAASCGATETDWRTSARPSA